MVPKQAIAELVKGFRPKYTYNSHEFIPGKSPVYYSGPYWDERELEAAIYAFLNSKWLVAGENVNRFQHQFSKKFHHAFSHMVNSGSSANLVMIAALKKYFNWNDGDEIIVSPVGFPTTITAIVQNNLVPVFVDIELNTLNIDLELIEEKITQKTRGIFVSPILGNPPNMDQLSLIANRHNLQLIGDNCDSLGTRWDDKLLTDFYIASSCSFYPAHHITTGEGGMISTNVEDIIKTARSIAWWGRDCYCVGAANLLTCGTCGNRFDKWLEDYDGMVDHKYVFTNMGYNVKPLDFQGAIGLAQLEKFDEIEIKRKFSKSVIEKLITNNIKEVAVASQLKKADPSWFGIPIICESQYVKESLVKFLEDNKIQTRSCFAGNILLHPAFKHLDDYRNYPNSNKALSHVFFIGSAPHYTVEIFDYLERVFKQWPAHFDAIKGTFHTVPGDAACNNIELNNRI
jgi:CDP-4-dehydro-6-deoxyglucose reductase, E1